MDTQERKSRKRHCHHGDRDERKKRRRHREEEREVVDGAISFNPIINVPIKKPINYPDAGSVDNKILPATTIEVSPSEKWVQQFFTPIKTPNKALHKIETQAILPMSIGQSIIIY